MTPRGVLRLLVCLGAGVAAACQRNAPRAVGAPVTVPVVPAVAPTSHERELSVVWLQIDGDTRSFFLESNAGELTVRGERPGSWFVHDSGVYRFKQTSARRSSTDCSTVFAPQEEPGEDAQPPPETLDLEVKGAVAERVDRPGEILLTELPQLENASTYDNGVWLTASAGKYLFIESSSDEHYCGAAHGFRTHQISAYDLKRREYHPLLDTKALAALEREQPQHHRQAFLACTAAYAQNLGPDVDAQSLLDDVKLAAIVPRFTPADGLYLELGWSLSVAYAFGSEEWGSYTSGCPATHAPVTSAFELEAPPRASSALLARHPKATVGGWSRLTNASDAAIGIVDAAFAHPPDEP